MTYGKIGSPPRSGGRMNFGKIGKKLRFDVHFCADLSITNVASRNPTAGPPPRAAYGGRPGDDLRAGFRGYDLPPDLALRTGAAHVSTRW